MRLNLPIRLYVGTRLRWRRRLCLVMRLDLRNRLYVGTRQYLGTCLGLRLRLYLKRSDL
jgi:hypothetical protein